MEKYSSDSLGRELRGYLLDFVNDTDISVEIRLRQARAIFTAYCLVRNVEADTFSCDNLLSALYDMIELKGSQSYVDFENFMLKDIV